MALAQDHVHRIGRDAGALPRNDPPIGRYTLAEIIPIRPGLPARSTGRLESLVTMARELASSRGQAASVVLPPPPPSSPAPGLFIPLRSPDDVA
jgi:hypothetical protein